MSIFSARISELESQLHCQDITSSKIEQLQLSRDSDLEPKLSVLPSADVSVEPVTQHSLELSQLNESELDTSQLEEQLQINHQLQENNQLLEQKVQQFQKVCLQMMGL